LAFSWRSSPPSPFTLCFDFSAAAYNDLADQAPPPFLTSCEGVPYFELLCVALEFLHTALSIFPETLVFFSAFGTPNLLFSLPYLSPTSGNEICPPQTPPNSCTHSTTHSPGSVLEFKWGSTNPKPQPSPFAPDSSRPQPYYTLSSSHYIRHCTFFRANYS